jgi:hypothetical protein
VTLEAGRGAPTPDAAADTYLAALSYGNDEGLLSLPDDDHQGDLLQWAGQILIEQRNVDSPESNRRPAPTSNRAEGYRVVHRGMNHRRAGTVSAGIPGGSGRTVPEPTSNERRGAQADG